jgi:hypothetical protein
MSFLMCCWIWLPLFYWGFLHLCSLRRLAYSSPFWSCLCLVFGWV